MKLSPYISHCFARVCHYAIWLELRRLPQILLVLVRRTIN